MKQRKESIKEGMKKETKELGSELKIVVLLHFLFFVPISRQKETQSQDIAILVIKDFMIV